MIKLRKLLACLMIACMAFSLMPLAAFATEGEDGDVNACEEHNFDSSGVCIECGYKCQHDGGTDGAACVICGMTVAQEQSDTQDDNSTAGENGSGAAGGSGTTGGNGSADEGGSGSTGESGSSGENGTAGENGTTSGNGTTGENGSGTTGEGETGATTNNVAQIGDTKYPTLAGAVDAMKDGDTVTLLDYVTENVIFNKNGTIDLGFYSITGAVAIQANVTFVGGSVEQGDIANAAIVINSGSLTLNGTTVTGSNGICVGTTGAASVTVGSNSTITGTEGYGICQTVVDPELKGTLSVICKKDSNIKAKTVGVEIKSGSYTAESDMDVMDRIECPGAVVLKIDEGSYSISGGMFIGDFSLGKGVTGSITGGLFSFDPTSYLEDGYIVVERDTLYEVVKGTKVGDAYVYTETVNENTSTVTAANGLTVAEAPAKTEGAGSAINKDAVLSKAAGFETGDNVEINVSLKAEVKEAAKDASGFISSATYSLTPDITLNVKGEADTQSIPYDASMINGSEITVTVPLVSGFVPETIVHMHADGSADMYKKGSAASLTEFVVGTDNTTVSFKVTSFSDFVMYANAIVCEVLDETGAFQKGCGSFSDAWHAICDAANNGKSDWTIKLLQDISIDEQTGYGNSVTWKLDLAGKTFKINKLSVYNAGDGQQNITIKDSSAAQTGKIEATGTATEPINIGGGCTVTLESGSIVNTNGTAVVLKDNKNKNSAHFVMKGGTLNGTTAIDAVNGSVEISGGAVTGTADTTGGQAAIAVGDNSSLTLSGGSVTNANGAAINVNAATAQFTMNNGTVNGTLNALIDYSTLTISGGEINGNAADEAIGLGDNVTLTLTGGSVINKNGVAIALNGNNSKLVMSGGTVNGSTRGVDMYGGTVQMSNGTIVGGTAIHSAGGSITITGGTLDSKDASTTQEVVLTITGSPTVAISGGSFGHKVPSAQCAAGYAPTEKDNSGRYSVALQVAQSTTAGGVTAKHATVQDAIKAAGAGGTITLLADSSNPGATSNSMTIDGNGKKMGTLYVNVPANVTIKNLKADTVNVAASATADFSGAETEIGKLDNSGTVSISAGKYKTIGGTGTYSITGGLFGIKVDDKWCAKVPVAGKTEGTASSLTKYTAVANTDPATKDEYPYTVAVAPAPRITKISNSAYFQRNSNGTLTIYTDRTVDELVENTNTYQKDKYPYRCLNVTSANGSTSSVSPSYYTVKEDDNGNAVITISNGFLKYKPVGTYSVQVEYTTGVTQWENFKIGISPKTGDESNIGLWIGIMACSVIIIGCGVFVLIHKSKKNKK